MYKHFVKAALLSFGTAFLISCGGEHKATEQTQADSTQTSQTADTSNNSAVSEMADFKFHYLIANIPSPMEIVDALPKAGIAYSKDVLNPAENESKYQTSLQKSLNFGVYAVDMAYLTTNEQFAPAKNYLNTSRNLAKNLEMGEIFDKVLGNRLKDAADNKDTLKKVIDEAYYEVDNYMRSNERALAATEMLAGSWIESQYITLSLVKDQVVNEKNKVLFEKIFEQKRHLESMVSLFKEYEKDKAFKPIIDKFNNLNKMYSQMKMEDAQDAAYLAKLQKEVAALRAEVVK